MAVPLIKMNYKDNDSNGKIDFYDLTIQIKQDPSKIRRIEVYGTFDYFVEYKLKMIMIGMIHMSVDTPLGASKVVADGLISLEQRQPVLIDSIMRSVYDVNPFLDVSYE